MEGRLFIETFEGPEGRAEVYEVHGGDPLGVEKVDYEIVFKGARYFAHSMGEASAVAADLSGDRRFVDAAYWASHKPRSNQSSL